MAKSSFDKRLIMVEIKAILLDSGLADETEKLAKISKIISAGVSMSDKDLQATKISTKELSSIRSIHKSLLDTMPGFLELSPLRRAALLYLTSRIGYVGVTQNRQLWDSLKNKRFDQAADIIQNLMLLKLDTRSVISDLIRDDNEN